MGEIRPINREIVDQVGRTHRYKLDEIRRRTNDINDQLGTAEESHTISAGAITITGTQQIRFVTVDGTGASTDLTTITGGNVGEIAVLQSANNSRDIVCKHGAGLVLGVDFTLNNVADKLTIICTETSIWHGIARQSAGS
uniref:Uncharacterized protein n=1 Tax=viral metagenome TaxID=1070528 RepID=A0A6M3IXZ9_9ZZZZ